MNLDINFEQKLSTITDPVSFLESFNKDKLLSAYEYDGTDVDEDTYNRIVLFKNEQYEVVFCHWKTDNASEMHDHDGKKCWFRCLKGALTEKATHRETPKTLTKDTISYIDDEIGEHQILNKKEDCAYSLHLYIRED